MTERCEPRVADAELPTECDVLVVGGGINGAGIARDLAGRGARVVLCEQDDLASHTSSASTSGPASTTIGTVSMPSDARAT